MEELQESLPRRSAAARALAFHQRADSQCASIDSESALSMPNFIAAALRELTALLPMR
jgi:hypothetical protein